MTRRTMKRRNEDGLTIVELAVTLMLLSIVSLMLFGFIDNVTSVTARADRHVRAEQTAQLVLRRMTQDIRAASPILENTDPSCASFGDCIRFDIPRQTTFAQECVRRTVAYKLDRTNRRITRDATDWVWNGSSCTATNVTTNQTVVDSLNFPSATPLFAYTTRTGDAVPVTKITAPPSADGTAAVRINLVIKYQQHNTPNLTLSSNAVLRNER